MNLSSAELFLLDMDGTLYLDDEVIKDAPQTVRFLRSRGRRVCFLTNNSSKSREAYFAKLLRLGFEPSINEIYTSGLASIEYLREHKPGQRVYLLGTDALKKEFEDAGITLTNDSPDIVVLGYDTALRYNRLAKACVFVRDGAFYLATHPDINCPAVGGYLPDAGAFIELIKASTSRVPDVICGKPFAAMARAITRHYHASPEKTVMIGDRLVTDIRFGNTNGFVSTLVLSGETTSELLSASADKPALTLNSIADLMSLI